MSFAPYAVPVMPRTATRAVTTITGLELQSSRLDIFSTGFPSVCGRLAHAGRTVMEPRRVSSALKRGLPTSCIGNAGRITHTSFAPDRLIDFEDADNTRKAPGVYSNSHVPRYAGRARMEPLEVSGQRQVARVTWSIDGLRADLSRMRRIRRNYPFRG